MLYCCNNFYLACQLRCTRKEIHSLPDIIIIIIIIIISLLLLLLLLLLLAVMTYNQVQSFQINDYANYYVDMKLLDTEHWTVKILQAGMQLDLAEPADCINRVFDCYIRVYQSLSIFIDRVQPPYNRL